MKLITIIIFVLIIAVVVLGYIFVILEVINDARDKASICKENNGVIKSTSTCINESGIYEIVYLNDEWRLIK